MAPEGFEILVNGIPRSFRDRKETAHEAALVLKQRWPDTKVVMQCTQTGYVITVRQDGRTD